MDGYSEKGVIRWKAEWSGGYTIVIKIEKDDHTELTLKANYHDVIPDTDSDYGVTEDDFKYCVQEFLEHALFHYDGCPDDECND